MPLRLGDSFGFQTKTRCAGNQRCNKLSVRTSTACFRVLPYSSRCGFSVCRRERQDGPGTEPEAETEVRVGKYTMRPEMITQMIRKQFFCVTYVCVCNWKINSQRIILCNWRLQKVPHGGAQITQKNSFQKALCNRCPV